MSEAWLLLLVQLRKRYTLLTEVFDLTTQMGEALDRDDATSFSMLLAMRQEPIQSLQEQEERIQSCAEPVAPRWQALCRGEAAQGENEQRVAEQMKQNKQLIDRLVPIDRQIQKVLSAKKA